MTFGIVRVVGNELPPRDAKGARLETLRWMLSQAEPTRRYWVLNHLHDADYRQTVIALLNEHRESYEELLFDPSYFLSLSDARDRIRYAVNINAARNVGIRRMRMTCDFVVSLDQDCYLTAEHWRAMRSFIVDDQAANPGRKYYALVMKRVLDASNLNRVLRRDEEPHLIFRHDAETLFDPSIPFGEDDKVTLLKQLGIGPPPTFEISGDQCRMAGEVHHLPSGSAGPEVMYPIRRDLRALSLSRLLEQLDARYRPVAKANKAT